MLQSSSPDNLPQNVISGIFCSSTRREFIDWRLSIVCVHSVMLVFLTQLYDQNSPLLPFSPSLLFTTTPTPLPWISTSKYVRTYMKCVTGGLSQIQRCRKVPFRVTFQMTTFYTAFCEYYFSSSLQVYSSSNIVLFYKWVFLLLYILISRSSLLFINRIVTFLCSVWEK